MKHLDFIFIGSAKDSSFKTLETAYHKKIQRYLDSNIVLIKDSKETQVPLKKQKETLEILKNLKSGDVIIICDEKGKSYTSVAFSQNLAKWQIAGKRLVFVIGGSFGMDLDLIQQKYFCLKLSDFTLPHELARVVLLEQVYRGLSLLAGEKYHHE